VDQNYSVRVLVAECSTVICRVVKETLATHNDVEVVGAVRQESELIQMLSAQQPDVVLLDVDLIDRCGMSIIQDIRRIDPHVSILVFTPQHSKKNTVVSEAVAAGANDSVEKPKRTGHVSAATSHVSQEIFPKVQEWGRHHHSLIEKDSTNVVRLSLSTTTSTESFPRIADPAKLECVGLN